MTFTHTRLNIVLHALTEAKGEIVSAAVIGEAMYGRRDRTRRPHLSRTSVKVAVCQLRKHLQDTHEIQSVRLRGYRLVALNT